MLVVDANRQVFIHSVGSTTLPGFIFQLVPDGLEFAESAEQLGPEHSRQQCPARGLAVAGSPESDPSATDDQIRRRLP